MALELVNKLPYDHPYRWDGTAVGGVKLWRPSELGADLALWLDAADTSTITLNGSAVSQWSDKSANGRNASQATAAEQPTYSETDFNGKPAIVWPNSGNSIRLTTPSFSAQTFFFVTRYSTGTQNTWHASLQGLFGEATTPSGVIGLIGTAAGTDTWYNANQFSDLRFDGGAETNTNIGSLVALPLPNTVLAASAGSPKAVGDGWVLGCDRLLNGRGWSGPISEIIATPTILSTDERQKLEGYLAWKWGLTANLPVDHPYKTTPPVVTQAPQQPLAADYGAGATTAYSLRYVSNSYSGPVIRVRESSGNTEQDFTPTQITDGTLLAFVAGNNGHVVTLYNQIAGGPDAVQTSAASQPKIVTSGVLNLENGKPVIVFDSADDWLETDGYIVELSQNNSTSLLVGRFPDAYVLVEADILSQYSSNFIVGGPAGSSIVLWVNSTEFGTRPLTTQSLLGFTYDGTNFQAYVNGETSGASGTAEVNPEVGNKTVIGSRADTAVDFTSVFLQEVIIYQSDETAVLDSIELDINDYYEIFI